MALTYRWSGSCSSALTPVQQLPDPVVEAVGNLYSQIWLAPPNFVGSVGQSVYVGFLVATRRDSVTQPSLMEESTTTGFMDEL